MTDAASLTPLQDMIMEVLAARHRLGERDWPIPRVPQNTIALNVLRKKGLVQYQPHAVECHWRAKLTEAGREMYLTSPPVTEEAPVRKSALYRQAHDQLDEATHTADASKAITHLTLACRHLLYIIAKADDQ